MKKIREMRVDNIILEYAEALLKTGLYGNSVEDVFLNLVRDAMKQAAVNGLLTLRGKQ